MLPLIQLLVLILLSWQPFKVHTHINIINIHFECVCVCTTKTACCPAWMSQELSCTIYCVHTGMDK